MAESIGKFFAFHYMFYSFLNGYYSRTIQDVNFNFSAILSLVEATNCVKVLDIPVFKFAFFG